MSISSYTMTYTISYTKRINAHPILYTVGIAAYLHAPELLLQLADVVTERALCIKLNLKASQPILL